MSKLQISSKWTKHRAKRGENWHSGLLVEHVWDNFDLVMFKVTWGCIGVFGALATFLKIRFSHRCLFKTCAPFSLTLFISVSCDSGCKRYFVLF